MRAYRKEVVATFRKWLKTESERTVCVIWYRDRNGQETFKVLPRTLEGGGYVTEQITEIPRNDVIAAELVTLIRGRT